MDSDEVLTWLESNSLRLTRSARLYRLIGELGRIRQATPALRRGVQVTRYAEGDRPGLFAVSRFDPRDGHEVLIVFNTSTKPIEQKLTGWSATTSANSAGCAMSLKDQTKRFIC